MTRSSTDTNLEAYVDTSALISFLDKSDSHHFLFCRLFSAPPKLVTTPLVIAEGQAWFLRRFDPTRGLQFMSVVEELHPLKVLPTSANDLMAATAVLRRFSDQTLTLADALGLHIMSARRIVSCWSTDFHLGLTGVPLAIHEKSLSSR